jgi:hypothetical protein
MPAVMRSAPLDRLMRPIHQWVWADTDRRLRKLLTFAEVETDGGLDILRAAEVTPDPLLRRLYLEHAIDELHHGDLFRERGAALLRARRGARRVLLSGNPLPGGHGLDDLRIDGQPDRTLLAFLHVAEKSAAGRFAVYRELVDDDPQTRAIFEEILRDEVFHMNYTYRQLTRIEPERYRRHVWHARAKACGNQYLRARHRDGVRPRHADADVLHPLAAVCVVRKTVGAPGTDRPGPDPARAAGGLTEESILR